MTEKEQDNLILKLKGRLMWPKIFKPDSFKPKGSTTPVVRWTTDLLLDGESLAKAQEEQLRIRKIDKNGKAMYEGLYEGYDGSYLRLERGVTSRAGKEMDPPKVIDAALRPVNPNILIGNGSVAAVRFLVQNGDPSVIEEFGGYKGYLLGVQILELVEFDREIDPEKDFVEEGSGIEDNDENDFTAESEDPFEHVDLDKI